MTVIDAMRPTVANNLRTRALAANMLEAGDEEAGDQGDHLGPSVCHDQHDPYHGDGGEGAPSGRLATEPEHDHQPQRDRGEVRDLHRGDRPELTGEPTSGQGTVGRP